MPISRSGSQTEQTKQNFDATNQKMPQFNIRRRDKRSGIEIEVERIHLY